VGIDYIHLFFIYGMEFRINQDVFRYRT